MNGTEVLFKEIQQFRQPLLWVFLIVISLFVFATVGFSAFKNLFLTESANLKVGIALLSAPIILLCVCLLLFVAKLDVQVRTDGLYLQFFPLHLSFHKIELDTLKEHEVVSFSPLKDYGGWGIRYGTKGKAYIVSGNTGVLLRFEDKNALCIGSQQPEKLNDALTKLLVSGQE